VLSRVHLGRYLDDAKAPPGGTDTVNGACRTRQRRVPHADRLGHSLTDGVGYLGGSRPALFTTLSADSGTVCQQHHIGAFDGAGDSLAGGLAGHRVNTSDTSIYYGLNARGAAGFTVGGQEIFPVVQQPTARNTRRRTARSMRATSMSAQGGGPPHLHGDPFHSTDGTCLYGPANLNYTSDSAHPPLWGFSLDGYNICGRQPECEQ
jgi:hypothetical protein